MGSGLAGANLPGFGTCRTSLYGLGFGVEGLGFRGFQALGFEILVGLGFSRLGPRVQEYVNQSAGGLGFWTTRTRGR